MTPFSSPEKALEGRPDKLSEAEEALYGILVPENMARALKPEDFADLYGQETINADKKKVAEREAQFQKQESGNPREAVKRRRGELFEAIANYGIEDGDWLGPNAEVIVPSRYDDIFGGVDSIVEFEQWRKRHLALAIDITKSDELWGKFAAIRESIDQERLVRLKYFRPQNPEEEPGLIPRVVIGADHKTMEEVADLILRFRRTRDNIQKLRKTGEKQKAEEREQELEKLAKQIVHHPIQVKFLLEIKAQLENFRDYAAKKNKPKIRDAYAKVLEIIETIEREKGETEEWENLERDFEKAGKDEVVQKIIENARRIGGDGP